MIPITVWKRFNAEVQRWDHNHIEDGHVTSNQNKPAGTPEQTRNWAKGTWLFLHKHLDGNKVI